MRVLLVRVSLNTKILDDIHFYYDDGNIIAQLKLGWVEWEKYERSNLVFLLSLSLRISAEVGEVNGSFKSCKDQHCWVGTAGALWAAANCRLLDLGELTPSSKWALPLLLCSTLVQPRDCTCCKTFMKPILGFLGDFVDLKILRLHVSFRIDNNQKTSHALIFFKW